MANFFVRSQNVSKKSTFRNISPEKTIQKDPRDYIFILHFFRLIKPHVANGFFGTAQLRSRLGFVMF